jgi:hypothetical protein
MVRPALLCAVWSERFQRLLLKAHFPQGVLFCACPQIWMTLPNRKITGMNLIQSHLMPVVIFQSHMCMSNGGVNLLLRMSHMLNTQSYP